MSAQNVNAKPNPHPFQVGDEEFDGIRVIKVSGELDLSTAPRLEEPLDAALAGGDASVVIDLSGCEFIDSTGIALIVRAWQRLDGDSQGNGSGNFALCGLNDQVRRLLEVSGLESSLPTFGSRDEALAQLRS